VSLLVAHHNERGEAEILAALDDLRDALDGHHLILQIIRADFHGTANRKRLA